jgi:uncharacterized protein YutE (UPF0331/DUF86 family)
MNDIVINKIQSIQRCVQRVREEYQADAEGFGDNYTRQDAAILNILRACELAIDLANHIIKTHKLGVPTSSADSFDLLKQAAVIDGGLADQLKRMTAFRNTIIYEYQRMDLDVVISVITTGLDDLIEFGDRVLFFLGENQP